MPWIVRFGAMQRLGTALGVAIVAFLALAVLALSINIIASVV